ncbi:MAG: hypothetical protein CL693_01755 [Cellvibrionaceae bacterium]|nr:hypothetical protein [Cellvibrionaceae bacterium]|tara:strand:- start:20963 stop:21955 length:993 start_codon:yes stop_codon:yes gene_type:complete
MSTTPFAFADAVSQAQDKLDRYYQAYENRSSQLEDVENQLFGYQNKLTRAQTDLDTATKELANAQKEQASAKIALVGDASQENTRALKLADHALSMAERGVRTRTKRYERTQNNHAELLAEKNRLESQIAADQSRIEQQESTLASTKQRAEKEAKSLLAAAQRAKKDAAKRIQAEQDQKERLAAIEAEQARLAEEARAIAQQKIETEVVSTEEKMELSELDKEALRYAQKEVARLENLLSDGKPGRPTFKRLTLGGNKIESKAFEFLGQNQYRVETEVVTGRQIFQIGKHKFRRTIPAADNGQAYVFIFDAKRPSRPRLVMYKKALLENI